MSILETENAQLSETIKILSGIIKNLNDDGSLWWDTADEYVEKVKKMENKETREKIMSVLDDVGCVNYGNENNEYKDAGSDDEGSEDEKSIDIKEIKQRYSRAESICNVLESESMDLSKLDLGDFSLDQFAHFLAGSNILPEKITSINLKSYGKRLCGQTELESFLFGLGDDLYAENYAKVKTYMNKKTDEFENLFVFKQLFGMDNDEEIIWTWYWREKPK